MEQDRRKVQEIIEAESKKNEAIGWIDTPISVIRNAIETLSFNYFLADAIGHGRITSNTFRQEIPVHTGGPGLTLKRVFTKDNLHASWHNNVIMATGTTALAVDKALDATFGAKTRDDTSELGSARTIVYLTRCAFAHDPFNPCWVVKGKYPGPYRVTTEYCVIEFDPYSLDGQRVKPEHHGGLEGYWSLLQYCLKQAESHPHGTAQYTPPDTD